MVRIDPTVEFSDTEEAALRRVLEAIHYDRKPDPADRAILDAVMHRAKRRAP